MWTGRLSYKKHIGLVLVLAGMALLLLPFCLVAIGNALGTTKPADMVIDNLGVFIVTFSPLLVLVGLLITIIEVVTRLTRP